MGNPIKKLLKQKMVYFGSPRHDGMGFHNWAAGVEVSCRFDYSLEMMDVGTSEEFTAEGQILTIDPLEREAAVYLGPISDLTAAQIASPRLLLGNSDEMGPKLKYIRKTQSTPNLKATWWVRVAWFASN